jgi:hypothetical protein
MPSLQTAIELCTPFGRSPAMGAFKEISPHHRFAPLIILFCERRTFFQWHARDQVRVGWSACDAEFNQLVPYLRSFVDADQGVHQVPFRLEVIIDSRMVIALGLVESLQARNVAFESIRIEIGPLLQK